ncbi:hypothetical protein M2404_002661 [Rheinheimera pacifica]|uniref:hypothetical protein n=1 Tax=Rheinheimera pacifica TaxID=173990 RepID=UPI002169F62B|nr:hypothetical protein [Rheinheimera pacifica]MCS4308306.1 hypothetical protein [Rheinheimera pacifica]
MKLNGWQRICCVLALTWVSYVAIGAYKDVYELSNNIEKYEQQILLIEEKTFAERDQRIDFLHNVISETEDKKVSTIIAAVFAGVAPPVFIYLILIWIIAGFKVAEVSEP